MKNDNRMMKNLVFYAVSLLLSLVIIIVSTTAFLVIIFFQGSVAGPLFYVFLGVIAANIGISAVSLRGILLTYPALVSSGKASGSFVITERAVAGGNHKPTHEQRDLYNDLEMMIIDTLKENNNRMLQSKIVELTGLSKATISKSLTSLEMKGTIIRVRKGVTNEVILAETG